MANGPKFLEIVTIHYAPNPYPVYGPFCFLVSYPVIVAVHYLVTPSFSRLYIQQQQQRQSPFLSLSTTICRILEWL